MPSPPDQDAFQYAIWRVVPSVERGESLNVGVVVFCRRRQFLAARTLLDEDRLRTIAADLDVDALRRHLDGMTRVAAYLRDLEKASNLAEAGPSS